VTDHIHTPGCICHHTDRRRMYYGPQSLYTFGQEDERHNSRHATRIGFAAGFVTCFVLFTLCLLWWMP